MDTGRFGLPWPSLMEDSSPGMLKSFVQADRVAYLLLFNSRKSDGGQNGQSAKDEKRLVDTVNHFWRAGVKAVGGDPNAVASDAIATRQN